MMIDFEIAGKYNFNQNESPSFGIIEPRLGGACHTFTAKVADVGDAWLPLSQRAGLGIPA